MPKEPKLEKPESAEKAVRKEVEEMEVAKMEFILGIVIFIADIWAIINIFQAQGASTGAKVLWTLLILFLPVIGLIIWWFAGPRASRPQRV
ncbi:MAG: PLD nuclease N-terminal domain-containing protein [Desulfobacterales bacterium]